ncbi:glycosyltransferase [Serinibacter salmoneus]|nr:glycosyltransferase family 2 protein [Serinibacter salmoneus]
MGPLAVWFEVLAARARRRARHRSIFAEPPSVSVVVPGYNEGRVLRACVASLLTSSYPDLEVILVDDGSSDDTLAVMRSMEHDPRVRVLTKPNGGKGSALNLGIAHARGEVLVLSDSDGVFGRRTIHHLIAGFSDPAIGAVCGDDRPVNLDRVQTRFLSLISHLGTGLMRRGLHLLRCLPVVSGNIGAFRRDVLEQTGPLDEDTLGEDLELTWRVYRAGYRVAFAPRALVYAESPSTVRGLWRQRVRWTRGLVQTVTTHRDMVGNPRFGIFGPSLVLVVLTGLVVPVLQVITLALVAWAVASGDTTALGSSAWDVLLWLGLPVALVMLVLAIALNGAWRDLRFVPTLLLWPVYSVVLTAVTWHALALEIKGAPRAWNKLERTGVVSIRDEDRVLVEAS